MIKNDSFKPKTVLIGLSGGVDSAVAAKLLMMAGFNVYGVYLRLWHENKTITQKREKLAKQTAQKIGLSNLIIVDAENIFKKYVIEYFINELKSGRTPNPCVQCNHYIKFKIFYDLAKNLDIDYIATGHYAKIIKKNNPKEIYKIIKAKDKNKDQTYFLWSLNQKLLKKIIFPLGDFTKEEVKKMAEIWHLNFEKIKESEDICFTNNLEKFIKKNIPLKNGLIIDATSNKVLRQHQGLPLYTLGQRKNICFSNKEPYYVIKKDSKKNILIVAPRSQKNLFTEKIVWLTKINFVEIKPKTPFPCQVKLRYRSELIPATLCFKKSYYLLLKKNYFIPTPGQSAVFYKNNELIGGGIIKK
jgi:tRNA-specific 2-thiouridylase